ncbi:MAG: MarR family transcriptional regulator [Treponema sp.]|nr:MarR family transcriptional regulator [Treponema sp.]
MQIEHSDLVSTISHIHSECAEFLRTSLAKKGLPNLASSHGYILYLLSVNPRMSMNELSKKINRDKSTTTVLVKKLETLGFVTTCVNPADSRSKQVELTQTGRTYNQYTKEISDELKKTFFADLNPQEITQLEFLLEKISSNFNQTKSNL